MNTENSNKRDRRFFPHIKKNVRLNELFRHVMMDNSWYLDALVFVWRHWLTFFRVQKWYIFLEVNQKDSNFIALWWGSSQSYSSDQQKSLSRLPRVIYTTELFKKIVAKSQSFTIWLRICNHFLEKYALVVCKLSQGVESREELPIWYLFDYLIVLWDWHRQYRLYRVDTRHQSIRCSVFRNAWLKTITHSRVGLVLSSFKANISVKL